MLYNFTIIRSFSVFTNKSQKPYSRTLSHRVRPVTPRTSARVQAVFGMWIKANSDCPHGPHNQCRAWEQTNQENKHISMFTRFIVYLYCCIVFFNLTSERSSLRFCLGNSGFIPVLLCHQDGTLQSDKRVQFRSFHNSNVM